MSPVTVTVTTRTRVAAAEAGRAAHADAAIRPAAASDVDAIARLVSTHVVESRLLPRSQEEIAAHVTRFLVAVDESDGVVACVDLAPLSRRVAEVRSLVVAGRARACGLGRRLVEELERRALADGFDTLCAFTHVPGYFVQLGFSIVPHVWLPEKIQTDCRTCPQFRQCGQYAVMLPLVAPRTAETAHAHA
jgi:amino-acid N-acetyltransferase